MLTSFFFFFKSVYPIAKASITKYWELLKLFFTPNRLLQRKQNKTKKTKQTKKKKNQTKEKKNKTKRHLKIDAVPLSRGIKIQIWHLPIWKGIRIQWKQNKGKINQNKKTRGKKKQTTKTNQTNQEKELT